MNWRERLVLLACETAGIADGVITLVTLTLVSPRLRARVMFSAWAMRMAP